MRFDEEKVHNAFICEKLEYLVNTSIRRGRIPFILATLTLMAYFHIVRKSTLEPEVTTLDIVKSDHVPSWLSECKDIYMDLGSNIGVQIKKLFEPEKYPVKTRKQRKVMELYTREFGKPRVRKQRNSGLCALGFEPNPKHQEKLRQIEKKYNEQGWKVQFFPHAISDEDKQVLFYTKDNSSETEDWAASLFQVRRDTAPVLS